jgi:hypothetical protein
MVDPANGSRKLRFALSSDLTQEQVLARAEADLRATQSAM